MKDEDLSPHVDEIMEAVGDKVSREEIFTELNKYITVFRLNMQMAKRAIVKRYGGASETFPISNQKKLEQIAPGEMSVNFIGKILSVNEKEIESKGVRKRIYYGLIGDETAVLSFTVWEISDLNLEKGSTISVRNAYTTEYQGRVQLNFGARTGIKKDESTEIRVDEIPSAPAKPTKIGEIRADSGRVEVTGRILTIEKKIIGGEKGPREIFTGMIGDDSGRIRF
ncbi:MAG: hypothetical protein OEV21_04610, partial [Thermoplasmata archaeon]|nr:hypothetical protein [Thermoplasmata archaeon]